MPIRCESWSLTVQPGHSVGKPHCGASSPQQTSTRDRQVSASAAAASSPRRNQLLAPARSPLFSWSSPPAADSPPTFLRLAVPRLTGPEHPPLLQTPPLTFEAIRGLTDGLTDKRSWHG